MIYPSPAFQDETLAALIFVATTDYPFIVCGSRYFGDAKAGSDFDFVSDNLSLFALLQNDLNWKPSKSEEHGYLDENTAHIIQRGKVQIIFAKSIPRRILARDYIVANGLDRKKTESWDKAYSEIPE